MADDADSILAAYGPGSAHEVFPGTPSDTHWGERFDDAERALHAGKPADAQRQQAYEAIVRLLMTAMAPFARMPQNALGANALRKPTAGTTPQSPQQTALERGKQGLYELEGRPFRRADDASDIRSMTLSEAQRHLLFYDHLKRSAADRANPDFARAARSQLAHMDRTNRVDAAKQVIDQHHAGPRSQTYWSGLEKFQSAQRPAKLNAAPVSSLPGTVVDTQRPEDRILKQYDD